MNQTTAAVLSCLLLACGGVLHASDRPNIIVIVSDDQGYSDVGFNGCKEIPTPHLDALAASGVAFDAGYASHPYCSPSRAGLLTGRYQQRFGHECNPGANESKKSSGLPLDETLLSDLLQAEGYRTAAIGKWHLGDDEPYWPIRRGFDEWFGFSGGGMSYWGTGKKDRPLTGVLRNGQVVPVSQLSHLTDDFSTEAVKFIERNQESPFFLYLAYNAPHAPDHATREHLRRVEHIEQPDRAVYGAMVAAMDAGIGRVMDTLKELGLSEDTLVAFYSDNGGRGGPARSLPFRGYKGMLFEGGIRVPFCVSWPGHLPKGRRFEHPVTALDIFPTVLSAAKIQPPSSLPLDGVDLLPHLQGKDSALPHQTLFWRYAMGDRQFAFAIRDGNMKLIDKPFKNQTMLFDLDADPGEMRDLSREQPETVKRLSARIRNWDAGNVDPLWLDPHGENVRKDDAAKRLAFEKASKGERQN